MKNALILSNFLSLLDPIAERVEDKVLTRSCTAMAVLATLMVLGTALFKAAVPTSLDLLPTAMAQAKAETAQTAWTDAHTVPTTIVVSRTAKGWRAAITEAAGLSVLTQGREVCPPKGEPFLSGRLRRLAKGTTFVAGDLRIGGTVATDHGTFVIQSACSGLKQAYPGLNMFWAELRPIGQARPGKVRVLGA